jgi:hypothetical protein
MGSQYNKMMFLKNENNFINYILCTNNLIEVNYVTVKQHEYMYIT